VRSFEVRRNLVAHCYFRSAIENLSKILEQDDAIVKKKVQMLSKIVLDNVQRFSYIFGHPLSRKMNSKVKPL
jgi:hypothetical protein